jgi:hypothetical protein
MPGMEKLLALAPAGATVLDLTRRLPASDKSPRVVRLGEW